jgi:uncharacterized membrane protein
MPVYPTVTRRILCVALLSTVFYAISLTVATNKHTDIPNLTLFNNFNSLSGSDQPSESTILGVNDKDETVGIFFNRERSISHERHAFVVRDKRATLLPEPKGFSLSEASSINNRGEIAGNVTQIDKENQRAWGQAARWVGNRVEVLGHSTASTAAAGITQDGTVFGVSGLQRCLPGAFPNMLPYNLNFLRPTPLILGVTWPKSKQEGKIIGDFIPLATSPNGTVAALHRDTGTPLLYRNGKQTELPTLPDAKFHYPFAVNDSGVAVGWAGKTQRGKPVVWFKDKMVTLALPEGESGVATAINAKGDMVVGSITQKEQYVAALWLSSTKVIDLNTYLPKDSKVKLIYATCINNNGTVGGYALENGRAVGFLLKIKQK